MFGIKNSDDKKFRFYFKQDEKAGIPLAFGRLYVMVDKETGVNYLLINGRSGDGGAESFAVTPLINADGKPLVDDVQKD